MRQIIFRSVFITLGSLLGAVGLVSLFLGIFSPLTMAKMFDGVNGDVSLYFYKSNYQKTKNINDLYLVVNKSIQFKNDLSIVEYFQKLLKEEHYDEFVDALDERNTQEGDMLQRVMLSNEDNRLKSRFVRALVSVKMLEDAFVFATKDLSNPDNFVLASLTEFVVSGSLSTENYNTIYLLLIAFEEGYLTAGTDFERAKLSLKAFETANFLVAVYDYDLNNIEGYAEKSELEAKGASARSVFNGLI